MSFTFKLTKQKMTAKNVKKTPFFQWFVAQDFTIKTSARF